ncbi:MAG: glycosyltransferase family 4 protein [Fibrobacterota bacterium]
MRIAILQRRMDRLGGAERLVHNLASGLAEKGHTVDFFVQRFDEKFWGADADRQYQIRFLRLNLVPRPLRLLMMGLYFRFRLRQYDIINIHNTYVHHWMILAVLWNKKFPPVFWYCNEPRRATWCDVLEPEQASAWRANMLKKYWFKPLGRLRIAWQIYSYRFLDRLAVRRFSAVLANSHYAGRMIEKAFGIKPLVCHAGIRFAEADAPAPVAVPYWLLVSRMVFHKNVDGVLRAFAAVKKSGTPVLRLLLAGQGPDLGRLKALAAELGLENDTEFTGYVDDTRLERLYAHAEFFIYIPVREPFGLTLIEAMKYGVPVIGASDGGGVEIVEAEKSGLLVAPEDAAAVTAAIARLMADPDLRQRLGRAAREKTRAYYSIEKFVERFEAVCREVCPEFKERV